MKETIASNLIRYRKGLRLSQERLAETVGVSRQSINNYEKAKTLPDSKTLSVLAKALAITLDDLLRPETEGLPNFRFRAHASFCKKPQFAALVLQKLEIYNALEKAVGVPPYAPESTPCDCVTGNEKRIQTIANRFRDRLGIGDTPIVNLFEAAEELGLKVIRHPLPIDNFFGLSACSVEQGAFVLVNSNNITIERQLFTLAHEIGHLIFHRDEYQDSLIAEGTKDMEKAREDVANYFASYLLVSQEALERALEIMPDVIDLKSHFRVSYTMMLKRLEELGKVNYGEFIKKIRWQYKKRYGTSLTKEIEHPPCLKTDEFLANRRFDKLVWQALEQNKITEMKAAELFDLTVEELRKQRQNSEIYAIS